MPAASDSLNTAIVTKIRIQIIFSMHFGKILLVFKKFTLTLRDISTKSF